MDEFLHAAAAQRGGYLFRSDLIDLGLRDRHIAQAVQSKVLERLRHGTYAPCRNGTLDANERYRLIAYSLADKLGPSVALSHHTAALVHARTVWGLDLRTVHVTRLDGRGGRTEAGVSFHAGRVVPEDDLCIIDGRQYVVADRAVVESNSIATVEAGMVTASFAIRNGSCDADQLRERIRRCERWPGMLHGRLALLKAEPRCESVGEVRSLYLFSSHRVPRPVVQYVVRTDSGQEIARCDFGWEDARHVGEFDGTIKYGRLNPYAGTELGQVIIDEKVREDRVRNLPYGMSRWMWVDLDRRPEVLARRILADLDNSRRLYGRRVTITD